MEFESSTPERVAAAIAFGSIGFAAIGAAYVFPETPLLVFVLGMVLLAVGLCLATWNTVVHVERRARRVTRIQRILFWTTIQRFPFASFQRIRIARTRALVSPGEGGAYRLELVGTPAIKLPGSHDKRTADDEAVGLSRLMGLPVQGRQLAHPGRRRAA